jgi:hypothetical protein
VSAVRFDLLAPQGAPWSARTRDHAAPQHIAPIDPAHTAQKTGASAPWSQKFEDFKGFCVFVVFVSSCEQMADRAGEDAAVR